MVNGKQFNKQAVEDGLEALIRDLRFLAILAYGSSADAVEVISNFKDTVMFAFLEAKDANNLEALIEDLRISAIQIDPSEGKTETPSDFKELVEVAFLKAWGGIYMLANEEELCHKIGKFSSAI